MKKDAMSMSDQSYTGGTNGAMADTSHAALVRGYSRPQTNESTDDVLPVRSEGFAKRLFYFEF